MTLLSLAEPFPGVPFPAHLLVTGQSWHGEALCTLGIQGSTASYHTHEVQPQLSAPVATGQGPEAWCTALKDAVLQQR